jgi:hypothetical protein
VRPWMAGCYFAMTWFVFWYVAGLLQGRARLGFVLGVVTAVPMGLLIAIGAKRRRLGRRDADGQPVSFWAPWSDRSVAWALTISVVIAAVSIISLALPSRSLTDGVGAIAGIWSAVDAAAERRLRRRTT